MSPLLKYGKEMSIQVNSFAMESLLEGARKTHKDTDNFLSR
jgi:hypothetical protein